MWRVLFPPTGTRPKQIRKIVEEYGIDVKMDVGPDASVTVLQTSSISATVHFYVIIANHRLHPFFAAES